MNAKVPPYHTSQVSEPSQHNILQILVRSVIFFISKVTNGSSHYKYSVEKLQAFQDYRSRTSMWWIFIAICITPFFSIGICIGMNFIPLQPPEEGWKANHALFLRISLGAFLMSRCVQWLCSYYIGRQFFSLRTELIMAVGLSIVYVGVMVCFAAWVAFPMRFLQLAPFPFTVPVGLIMITVAANQRRNAKKRLSVQARSPDGQQQPQVQQQPTSAFQISKRVKLFKRFVVFGFFLISIYSLLGVGFTSLRDRPYLQAIYSLLFPILKIFLNRFAHKFVFAHVEDLMAESVVFTVTFFDALIVCMCLNTAASWYSPILFLSFDVVNILLELIGIQHKCSALAKLVKSQERATTTEKKAEEDLIGMVLDFAQKHRQDIVKDPNLRWYHSNHLAFQQRSRVMSLRQISHVQTFEEATTVSTLTNCLTSVKSTRSFQESTEILKQVLILLFDVEYLVLMEFIEVFIPYMYAVYLLVTYYSPCQNYIIGTRGMSPEAMILSLCQLCLYGTLEFGSLLLFYLLIRWKFRINLFHVLAFVLETHFKSIQAKLFILICVVLHFNLIHLGMLKFI